MKLRMARLIQAVFAMIVAVSLSFGAKQVFASAPTAVAYCWAMGYDYYTPECGDGCLNNAGYCSEGGICRCGYIP